MSDVFDHIYGQPRVREFLRASVGGGRVTHAYLFTGPAGSNKTQAAYALDTVKCTARPNGDTGSDVLGGVETRITWEGQATEAEQVSAITLKRPACHSLSAESSSDSLLSPVA